MAQTQTEIGKEQASSPAHAGGPEQKFQRGGISVSIFANDIVKNGQAIEIKKAVFQKRYRDANDQWQTTSSLDVADIPKAILALGQAYEYVTRPKETDFPGAGNGQGRY